MIDLGAIREDESIYYMDHRGKYYVLLDCLITRGGINYRCCKEIISISEFEAHSRNQLSDPLRNICIDGVASLLLCMLHSWSKQNISKHQSFHFIDPGEDSYDATCVFMEVRER